MKQHIPICGPPLLKSHSEISERGLVVIDTFRRSTRPEFADVYRREIEELPRFQLALTELLFRLLALGDIHIRPDKCYDVARLIQGRMPDSVDVLGDSIGKNNAVVCGIVCFLDFGPFEELQHALLVLEMGSAKPQIKGRRLLIRFDAVYSKHLR